MIQTILVVDDNKGIRSFLKELLVPEGYLVLQAANGLEAIETASQVPLDLIILDIRMPCLSGLEVLHHFKKSLTEIPVILISAYTNMELINKIKEIDPDIDYVGKPFDLVSIRELVREKLKNRGT